MEDAGPPHLVASSPTGRRRSSRYQLRARQVECAHNILIHLAESEIALGNRARMALAKPGYTAQAFDQDQVDPAAEGRSGGSWVSSGGSRGSSGTSGPVALQALAAMNAFFRALFGSLSEKPAGPRRHAPGIRR